MELAAADPCTVVSSDGACICIARKPWRIARITYTIGVGLTSFSIFSDRARTGASATLPTIES